MKTTIVFLGFFVSCLAYRSPYSGRRPVGYPYYEPETTVPAASGNGFGTGEADAPSRLPIEALGDADLVAKLSKLPVDQQPFWLLNWQAAEAHRNNPHYYPHRVNNFIDNIPKANQQESSELF